MINSEQLNRCLAVAKCGRFTKAAAALYLTTPTLSKSISDLENALGAVLFDRNHAAVSLTEQGQLLFKGAERILGELAQLEDEVRAAADGKVECLRISTAQISPKQFNMLLRTMMEREPALTYQVSMALPGQIISALLDGECDIGVTLMQEYLDSSCRGKLDYLVLEDGCGCVINMSRYHPLASQKALTLEDISPYQMLYSGPDVDDDSAQSHIVRKRLKAFALYDADNIYYCENTASMVLHAHTDNAVFSSASIAAGSWGADIISIPLIGKDGELCIDPGDRVIVVWCKANRSPCLKRFISLSRKLL